MQNLNVQKSKKTNRIDKVTLCLDSKKVTGWPGWFFGHKDVKTREIQTKTQSHVGWNTRTLWDAHSTQRHRGTETQREELNIELKKQIIILSSMFNSSLCVSVPLC
jgi:hypothetical protein